MLTVIYIFLTEFYRAIRVITVKGTKPSVNTRKVLFTIISTKRIYSFQYLLALKRAGVYYIKTVHKFSSHRLKTLRISLRLYVRISKGTRPGMTRTNICEFRMEETLPSLDANVLQFCLSPSMFTNSLEWFTVTCL